MSHSLLLFAPNLECTPVALLPALTPSTLAEALIASALRDLDTAASRKAYTHTVRWPDLDVTITAFAPCATYRESLAIGEEPGTGSIVFRNAHEAAVKYLAMILAGEAGRTRTDIPPALTVRHLAQKSSWLRTPVEQAMVEAAGYRRNGNSDFHAYAAENRAAEDLRRRLSRGHVTAKRIRADIAARADK